MQEKLLRIKLLEYDMNVADLAKNIGISKNSIYRKMKGQSEFTRDEINNIAKVLELTSEEILKIFFGIEVS